MSEAPKELSPDLKDEMKFLHDIASPLTSVLLNLENVAGILAEKKPEDIDACLKMIQKCLTQTKKSTDLLSSRRTAVMEKAK